MPENLTIKDVEIFKCPECKLGTSILEATQKLEKTNSRQIIVVENKKPIGIITFPDIVYKVVSKNKSPKTTKVDQVCTKDIYYLDINEPLSKACVYMSTHNHFFCPITENDRFVGLLTFAEAMKHVSKNGKK